MSNIGIIGAGIGGLLFGLALQQRGIQPTLYAEYEPEQIRRARLPNTAALFDSTLKKMRSLEVSHWDEPDTRVHEFDFSIEGMPQFGFRCRANPSFQFIDMRLCLPKLLEDFRDRGGRVRSCGSLDHKAVDELGLEHDLVVVASGRGELSKLFPRIPERSPFDEPQRRLLGALFEGIELARPFRFSQRVVPGHGEIGEFPFLTARGVVSGVLILAVPGGSLEPITHLSHADDPAVFNRAVFELLRDHSSVAERIKDPTKLRCLGPLDLVQGAVLPVVRRGVRELSSGRFALALGDAHVTADPIIAQGANAAARVAFQLADLLAGRVQDDGAFDADFCTSVEAELWRTLQPVSDWSSAALGPPAPHVMELTAAAASNPVIAEQFVRNFDDPQRQWEVLSRPENTAAFIQSHAGPS